MTKNFTAVVADLHGRFDLFEKSIKAIDDYQLSDNLTVVFLGDYVDRGPQSAQIVEALIKGPTKENQRWVYLMGNHEHMMIAGLLGDKDNIYGISWYQNEAIETLKSYGIDPEVGGANSTLMDHVKWMAGNLDFWYEDKMRLYVHGWAPHDKFIREVSPDSIMWNRFGQTQDEDYMGKYIVHGHTPMTSGPIILKNRANFDTGSIWSGKQAIGIFDDDLPGPPVEILYVNDLPMDF